MARKKRDDGGGGESWMNTYADMVTLLLTFFVMLFSMSTIEQEKWEMLLEAFTNNGTQNQRIVLVPTGQGDAPAENKGMGKNEASGEEPLETDDLPTDMDQLYEALKRYIADQKMETQISIEKGEETVFIRFSDNVFFDPNKYQLKKESMGVLSFLGDCLKHLEDQLMVININGHTASTGRENSEVSDRRLSAERAASVAIYLEEQKHINPKIILAVGYGKNFPIDTNSTAAGMKRNRRVEMLIVSNKGQFDTNSDAYQSIVGAFSTQYPASGGSSSILFPDSGAEPAAQPDAPPENTQPIQMPDIPDAADREDVSPYQDTQ